MNIQSIKNHSWAYVQRPGTSGAAAANCISQCASKYNGSVKGLQICQSQCSRKY